MNTATYTAEGKKVRRITRAIAKRLYEANKTLIVVPCNLDPVTDGTQLNKLTPQKDLTTGLGIDTYLPYDDKFDTVTMFYTYYHCNPKNGRYPAFYAYSQEDKA